MTDHLPECPCIAVGVPSCICDNDEECGPQCRHRCICTALRACEARVMASDEPWAKASAAANVESYDEGFAAGLAAARDAVAALFPQRRYPDEHAAILAAIDGLRGES